MEERQVRPVSGPGQGRWFVRVLLVTEGTYPFHFGGLGHWCDLLVKELSDVEFTVLGIAGDPKGALAYRLPRNVVRFVRMPLWGVREAAEHQRHVGFAELVRRSQRASEEVVAARFVPTFRAFIRALWEEEYPASFGALLLGMRKFFLEHDFDSTLRSRAVWNCFAEEAEGPFVQAAAKLGLPGATVHLDEVSDSLTLLMHWLMPLGLTLPVADVTHAASAGLSGLVGAVTKLERGTAFLLSEHGIFLRERYLAEASSTDGLFRKTFRLRFARRLTELGYRHADRIAPGSEYNRRWELALGAPSGRIRTVRNGVDPGRFTPAPKPPDAPPLVVWLGRIHPVKDIFTLLESAAVVHQARPDIRFRLHGVPPAGSEDYMAACLAVRTELGLEEVVSFEGFAHSAESAFNAGDLVVLTSVAEGFPFTVVEAMLCGRPVVGTAVGGVPEAVEGCGIAVEPRNPQQTAQAILELMADPARREALGRAAREKAVTQFNLAQCTRAYRQLYGELVHGARRRARAARPQGRAVA